MKDFILRIKAESMRQSSQIMIRAKQASEAVQKAKEHWGEDTKVLVLESRDIANPFS